jgi:formyl-CoA transferase
LNYLKTGGTSAKFIVPAMVPKLSKTPGATAWAGPKLGEHTDEILENELGLSGDEIAALRVVGAI